MSPDTSNTLRRTPYRLVITVCLVLTSLGCTRAADKFCAVDQETLKQNLIRLVESPVIKDDDGANATSITIDSVEPLPASDGKAEALFVVHWTTGVGDARAAFRKVARQPAKGGGWTLSRDGSGSPFGRQLA